MMIVRMMRIRLTMHSIEIVGVILAQVCMT